jgi:hypothetical protein
VLGVCADGVCVFLLGSELGSVLGVAGGGAQEDVAGSLLVCAVE